MKTKKCRVFYPVFLTALFMLASSASRAEEVKTSTLKEVVVTAKSANPYKVERSSSASKIDVPLKDIPAAIVVIPRQLLEDRGVMTMDQAVKNVSGVAPTLAGNYGFANRYLVRGLSQRFLRDGYTDGPSQNGYYRTLWDVESLEFLKGPGSALYGRGEPGGTVNVVTKKPVYDFQGEYSVTAGSFGTIETYLDLGGQVLPGAASRLIAGYQRTDGFRNLERELWGVFPTVSWKPDDNQTWTLDFDYRHIETVPDNYGLLFANGALITADHTAKYYSPFNRTEQDIHRLTLSHEWSENESFTLRNAFIVDSRDLYLLRNASGSATATGTVTSRDAREQADEAIDIDYQIEGVWKSDLGPWWEQTLLTGFEYEHADIDTVRQNIALPNIANVYNPVIPEGDDASNLVHVPNFDRNVSSDTVSFYAQEMIELTEQWKVRGGARFDQVWFADDGFSKFPNTTSPYVYRLLDYKKDLFSWQAGIVYQPVETISVYGGVSDGRFINIQTEATSLSEQPEEASQNEVGIKADWFGGKLSTNIALFQTERKNYYVTPFGGGNTVPEGQQETYGAEFDITASPYVGWTVAANLALYDAEFTSDQLSGTANLKGKDPQSVPESQASFWVEYEVQDRRFQGLGFGIGGTHQSSSFADAANNNKVPGYWVGDLAVFYERVNDEVRLSVKNFTNEEYFTSATFSGAAPGDPINVSVTYKTRF